MNWQQIAADALAHEPNVPDAAVQELAGDLALTTQDFIEFTLPKMQQDAIDEASK